MTASGLKELIKISDNICIVINAIDYKISEIKEFVKLCVENDCVLRLKNAKCITSSDLKEISKMGKKHIVIDIS